MLGLGAACVRATDFFRVAARSALLLRSAKATRRRGIGLASARRSSSMLVPGQPAKKLAKNQPAARIPSVLQVASEIA